MFRIDKDDNSIKPLKARGFSEFGFKERKRLQKRIAMYPSCCGGALPTIRKKFDDFSCKRERIHLLALKKVERRVVIENKLAGSSKDVTRQVTALADGEGLTQDRSGTGQEISILVSRI